MSAVSDSGLASLQNGSDIRGIALQTSDNQVTLTDERIERIAYGLAVWLKEVKQLPVDQAHAIKVAIGYDSRLSAQRIQTILIENLTKIGIDIIDAGLATTPAMFMSTQYEEYQCDAAIMITASHLPYEYNGLKFFTKDGGAEHEDIAYILKNAAPHDITLEKSTGIVIKKSLLSDYAVDLVAKIQKWINDPTNYKQPLTGRHIVVDAGNGAGGFFATEVLEKLGANIKGSQFLEPDGNFPNHIPNPDNKEAMQSIQTAVLKNKADLGIIFDTDVDRSALVDHEGVTLNRNNLIAVIAAILIKENPGTTIVTNSTTSEHLKTFIEDLGGKQNRYLTGYRNVINQAIELNKEGIPTSLAIETSGHAALKENFFLDDGAYLAARILIADAVLQKENKTIISLIEALKQPVETDEVRFRILSEAVQETGMTVLKRFKEFIQKTPDLTVEPNNLEGVRVNTSGKYGTGWLLLRLSLHEPLLVLNLESDQQGAIKSLRQDLREFFTNQTDLDASRL
ncbi:phosphohexomutase domain-containing protein [Carnobacterium mobile]|uniref:phosphoglucomutase n=1 Tax=Carnobacterium mobile TaxID=2750 RepID=UPI000558E072|nr:phosphoglucomutase [Carnobacterium mobile]